MVQFPNRFLQYCVLVIICYGAIFVASSCTENPFANAPEIMSRKTITGKVVDKNSGLPLRAYVWMEDLNIGEFTDRNGRFVLTLPPASQQPGGGETKVLQLFVYVGNYQIQFLKVVLRDGEFVYSQGVVNQFGEIETPINLAPLVEILTQVNPTVITENYEGPLDVIVKIVAFSNDVEVRTQQTNIYQIAGVIVEKIDSVSAPPGLLTITAPVHRGTHIVTTDTLVWKGKFDITSGTFQKGEYVLAPYLWVQQPAIPRDLFKSIGAPIDSLAISYRRIPYSRKGGKLFVVEPKG